MKSHHTCPKCGFAVPCEADVKTYEPAPRPASEVVDPMLVPLAEKLEFFSPSKKRMTAEEQRRHKRMEAHFRACIRAGGAEDVVSVIDFSRAGLRFASYKLYSVGTIVEVASPYTVGGNNIFSRGRIMRARRRPTEEVPGEYALEITY